MSLAQYQANAVGPAPTGMAIHIVLELARVLATTGTAGQVHELGRVSSVHALIGYDGSVALAEPNKVHDRVSLSYLSPEQVSGSPVDGRAEVFSLGIILWELLAGTKLFARATDAAKSVAILDDPILDVLLVNPDVPPIIGEVVATALARNKRERFDSVVAFGRALASARASCRIPEPSPQDVARWVAEGVPRSAPPVGDGIPDLDMPGSSRARRSSSTSTAAVVPPTSVRSAAAAVFSEINLVSAPQHASTPQRATAPEDVPPLQPVPAPPQQGIALASSDDDDFDMQIERNLTSPDMRIAASSPSSGGPGAEGLSGPHSAGQQRPGAGSGLELGAPQRLSARADRRERAVETGLVARIGGFLGATAAFGLTSAALFRFVHRAGGRPVASLFPHAFDGTSANESGALALIALVVAVTIIFVGLRLQPHAWSIVAAGGAMLVLALAMVTVTLASTGDNPTPPDGVLLVPYVAPVAILLLGLGMGGRAGRILARARGVRRLGGVPLAVIAGALAFVAFEVSGLATRY